MLSSAGEITNNNKKNQTGKMLHCKDDSQSFDEIWITFGLGELLQ